MTVTRYELIRTIASGGMGQVYEAIAHGHDGFTRKVAIKRLLPELLGDEAARRMFRAEARIASRLHHGNVVQTLDYGVVDGHEFLVLEMVDGIDGHKLQQRGPLPRNVAMYIVSELAHALAYAHDHRDEAGEVLGIVHRDVSPHNLLLSWEGDVKLSDFGIAIAADRVTATRTGMVRGKAGYLAPEQLLGQRATPASDIYALGATIQQLAGAGDPEIDELIARCKADEPLARPSALEVAHRAAALSRGAGRSELRAHLAQARTAATPRSALDDLMGMALVPASDGTFTLARTVAVERAAIDRDAPTVEARRPVRPGRWRFLLGAVAAFVLIGVVLVVIVDRDSKPTTIEQAQIERVPDASQVIDAAIEPTTDADVAAEPSPLDAAIVAEVPVDARAPGRRDAGRTTRPPREVESTPTPTPTPTRPTPPALPGCIATRIQAPLTTANLQTGVATAIDGVPQNGAVPHVHEAASGNRHVTLTDMTNGKVLYDRVVSVLPGTASCTPVP